ncbi:replication initiator [Actinoallomurus iriomotensis]|uniref:Replication initiation protein n=1 Tax=Actinoallomurus iriomotensis TaxID=478107 RepID=A0A9W6VSG9_9ACTN|nr:replication initiator [Actinoallomurus iriomotensis]GLY83348.1 replication initiation protein [Actinoallomurus iriomotensis]
MPANEIIPLAARELAGRLTTIDLRQLSAQARRTGGCAQPIRLRGRVDYLDTATGEVLHHYSTSREPGGVLHVACKTRRASRCPACAEIYRADTYQLVRAGLIGGKGVPETVADHPTVFVTLTAPSFGAVHARREKAGRILPCRPRRGAGLCPHGASLSCTIRHDEAEPCLGEPLCLDCYDYTASVLFNAYAPELWRRFVLAFRRRLAKSAGLRTKELRDVLLVSFAKVAEYQRRGVVHFHAVIRFDGPDGPTCQPPCWATHDRLDEAVRHAAAAVSATRADRPLRWGEQVDVRPITMGGELTERAVAGYIAKYATKAAECVGTLDRRIRPTDDLTALPVSDHARRLITECLRLGAVPELADLKLTDWAHMLGFRGHFSTKSRRYSTTLGALRAARTEHNQAEHEITTGRLPYFDEDQVLKVARWRYLGQGLTHGEALLTAALSGQPMNRRAA